MALIPSQKYRLKWPLTSAQVINIDQMFQEIFDFLKRLYDIVATLTVATNTLTSTISNTGISTGHDIPGMDGHDGADGMPGLTGATGLQGSTGPIGPPGADADDTGFIYPPPSSPLVVVDESADTTCFPIFNNSATGDLIPKSNSALTFDASTGNLGATRYKIGSNIVFKIDGTRCIFLGVTEDTGPNTGADNTFIGTGAGRINTTGNNNTFIGTNAGRDSVDSVNNVCIGSHAGYRISSGTGNFCLGTSAGQSLTTATNNVFVGVSAGYQVTGSLNVALGTSAQYNLTTGGSNITIGANAGPIDSASNNIVVGYGCGAAITGSNNICIGTSAASGTLVGGSNVGIGDNSLRAVTGLRNTSIGMGAGYGLTSGDMNTAIGGYACYITTTGSNNTFIGYMAGGGSGGITSGNYNTIISGGDIYTQPAHANTSGAIALGYGTKVTASNQMVVGGSQNTNAGAISAVYIGNGVTEATPLSFSLNASGASGTDVGGANITIAGGKSTGTGAGGYIAFSTAAAAVGSGSGLNSLTERFRIGTTGDMGLASLKKLYFDGVALTGDTYILESAANTLDTYVGATLTQRGKAGLTCFGVNTTTIRSVLESTVADANTTFGANFTQVGLSIINTDTTVSNWSTIIFSDDGATPCGAIGFQYTDHTNNYGNFYFGTRDATSFKQRMSLGAGGVTVTGVATNDAVTLGAEFLSAAGWTSVDWTGDWATGWDHTTGNTTALSQSSAAVVGTFYHITWTVTGRTAGTFTVAFGGYTSASQSATGAFSPKASTTGNLVVTPTSTFDGAIVFSIKPITGTIGPILVFNDSSDVNRFEYRYSAGSATSYNTWIGTNAGRYCTNGVNNMALGRDAGGSITSGSYNVLIGYGAGYYVNLGNRNICIGNNAGTAILSSSDNILIGDYAGRLITTGTGQNIAIGPLSLYTCAAAGLYNVALGYGALYGATSSANTGIGVNAISGVSTTGNNVGLGYGAGRYLADGSTGNSTPTNCTYIGTSTKANAAGLTNENVFGYAAIGAGSNSCTLGDTNVVLTILRPKVAIGAATPSAYLHLGAGSAAATTAPLKFTSGPLNTAAEAGAIEFLTDDLYFTQTTSTIRKKFLFSVGAITTATTTYTALSTDETIICNSTTAFTVSLPVAVVGQKYVVKNINTGVVTVDADSTDLIDGVATQTLGQWDCIQLQCYAANSWGIL